MSKMFSVVTLASDSGLLEEYYAPGSPDCAEDLLEDEIIRDDLRSLPKSDRVYAEVGTYLYGEGETERASEEDLIKIEHAKKSAAWIGVEYCDVMFLLEKRWHDLAPEDRKEKRQAILAKVMDAFYTWLGNLGQLPKTKLGKAADLYLKREGAVLELTIPVQNQLPLRTALGIPG